MMTRREAHYDTILYRKVCFQKENQNFAVASLISIASSPLYCHDEVDDLDDFDSPLRAVAQVATGVDKEEEEVLYHKDLCDLHAYAAYRSII